MSAPVDVLAEAAKRWRLVHEYDKATAADEARAAVAELIGTQRELLLEIERSLAFETDVMQRVPNDTLRRANAALARVGGAK